MRLPKNWGEVTLKQYIEVVEITAVDMDDLDKHVKILSALSKQSEDSIWDLSLTDVKGYIRSIQFIYTKPDPGKVNQKINIKGSRYRINLDVRKITGGEYIDLNSLMKDKHLINQSLPQILSIFFKPVNILGLTKKRYYKKNDKGEWIQTLESRDKTAKLILDHLTMDTVFNMSGFFLRNWENLTKATLNSIQQTNQKTREKILKELKKMDSKNTGRGI